jgi:hypothetical protein
MNLFKDLVKKYGLGMILGAATLDGYRRQVINDRTNNTLDIIQKEREIISEASKAEFDKSILGHLNYTKSQAALGRCQEAADDHKKAVERYNADPSEYNKNELDKAHSKLNVSYDEIKKLDISDFFISLYDKYSEFLDTLTADKIVCLFNIIIDGLIFSSFISVLSIMLSENIINQMVFLEKYPRILKFLRLRNVINKKVSKFYLLMHFILIISGILGNIYMFFI